MGWTAAVASGVGVVLALALPASSDVPDFAPMIKMVTPSVAFVLSKDENGRLAESGTAFVVDPTGLLLTALHVVDEASQISVLLPSQRALGADVIGIDVDHDVALLSAPSMPRPGPPALALGNSSGVHLGETVLVVGYPLPSPQSPTLTVTHGIVSALRTQAGYIQIDAPVNPGDSGGPVLTRDGKVIGIVDASVRGAQNFNFAIPSDFAGGVLARVASGGSPAIPMTLPLTSPASMPLVFSSPGIGPHGRDQHLGAACAPPPPHAAVLDDVGVALRVQGTLHVVTWLSWQNGAPLNSEASFARLDGTQARQLTGMLARLHLQPDTVCLNYEAWNTSIVPIGLTFSVQYTLGYRVFKEPATPATH
jgi:hypothetical protein